MDNYKYFFPYFFVLVAIFIYTMFRLYCSFTCISLRNLK